MDEGGLRKKKGFSGRTLLSSLMWSLLEVSAGALSMAVEARQDCRGKLTRSCGLCKPLCGNWPLGCEMPLSRSISAKLICYTIRCFAGSYCSCRTRCHTGLGLGLLTPITLRTASHYPPPLERPSIQCRSPQFSRI